VDGTTTRLNHFNQQMPYESCTLISISGSAMIVGMKMTHIFSNIILQGYFKCIQFLLADRPYQAPLDFELGRLADFEGRRIYSEMNMSDWWWDTQDQLPSGGTIVPIICASDKTHLTNFSGDQHASPLYLTLGNIRKDICHTPKQRAWIHFGLMQCPPKGAKNIDEA
jgi:hypothetical protein